MKWYEADHFGMKWYEADHFGMKFEKFTRCIFHPDHFGMNNSFCPKIDLRHLFY